MAPHEKEEEPCQGIPPSSRPSVPSIGGIKGTNGTPKHTASPTYRKYGITYTGNGAKSTYLQGDGASILLKVDL
jgi:hypothetical protein